MVAGVGEGVRAQRISISLLRMGTFLLGTGGIMEIMMVGDRRKYDSKKGSASPRQRETSTPPDSLF